MDRDRTELAARALRLLLTSSTALNRRVVPVRTVPFVNTHVVQGLACGAEIAVFFRHVSELLDPVWIRGRVRTFLHANVRCNPTFIEPLQHFPVAVGVIGCHPLWPPTISFAVAIDHIAWPHSPDSSGRPSLAPPRSHSFHCRSDSYRSNPVRQRDFPWSGTSNPGRWSTPCLADGWARHRRSPALVLPGTSAPHSSLALPPGTVRGGYDCGGSRSP